MNQVMRKWLVAWMLCWAGLAWSFVCVPQPPTGLDEAEEAAREGYAGYQPTGDKGALERDALWWGAVRPVRREGRLTGYALRRADAAWRDAVYDSITPVALGGPRHGFIAGRGGCVRLLDTAGRPLVPEWLEQIQVEGAVPGVSPDTVWLKLTAQTGPQRSAYTLVRFMRGRLVARAPGDYIGTHGASAMETRHGLGALRGRFRGVSTAVDGRRGILRQSDLREIVPLQYQGVGALGLPEGSRMRWVLFADRPDVIHLFDTEGQRLEAPAFDRVEVVHSGQTSYLELVDGTRGICHLMNDRGRLLVDAALPLASGRCPRFEGNDVALVFSDAQGRTHGYAWGSNGTVHPLFAPVSGRLEVRQASGLMVLREAGEPSRWRVVGRDGRDLYAQRFEGFEHLGCGSVRLRRDGQWLQLRQDGSLSERLRFPFSC